MSSFSAATALRKRIAGADGRHGQALWADSLIARTAATMYGSTETTSYVLAVYFGAVGVKRTRHAIAAGLIGDTVAVLAAAAICSWMF